MSTATEAQRQQALLAALWQGDDEALQPWLTPITPPNASTPWTDAAASPNGSRRIGISSGPTSCE